MVSSHAVVKAIPLNIQQNWVILFMCIPSFTLKNLYTVSYTPFIIIPNFIQSAQGYMDHQGPTKRLVGSHRTRSFLTNHLVIFFFFPQVWWPSTLHLPCSSTSSLSIPVSHLSFCSSAYTNVFIIHDLFFMNPLKSSFAYITDSGQVRRKKDDIHYDIHSMKTC